MKPNKPSVGYVLLAVSFVFAATAFVLYFTTYNALHYEANLYVIALTVIGLWSFGCLLANGLFAKNRPFWMDVFFVIGVFALVLAAILFLSSCLSPIGIYFTVNMGDVEANAAGVPRCLAGVAFYALSAILATVAAFLNFPAKEARDE